MRIAHAIVKSYFLLNLLPYQTHSTSQLINNFIVEMIFNLVLMIIGVYITGHTDDYGAMVEHLEEKYPKTFIVAVGFSLGGNIVTKYMGEHEAKLPNNIIGGISICQGYNAVEYVQ